jgi:hypothetical protein
LRAHKKWHIEGDKWLTCKNEGCGFKSKVKVQFVDHKEVCPHKKKTGGTGTKGGGRKLWKCEIEGCAFQTEIRGNMKQHMVYKHNPMAVVYQCPHCEHSTNNKQSLKKHVKNRHQKEKIMKGKEGKGMGEEVDEFLTRQVEKPQEVETMAEEI